jgi:hypothetical protein
VEEVMLAILNRLLWDEDAFLKAARSLWLWVAMIIYGLGDLADKGLLPIESLGAAGWWAAPAIKIIGLFAMLSKLMHLQLQNSSGINKADAAVIKVQAGLSPEPSSPQI